MNTIKAFGSLVLAMGLLSAVTLPAHADEHMMKSGDKMMMESKDHMMMKADDKMMMAEDMQVKYSEGAFAEAQESGKPFLVAFHKKGCHVCADQQKALNEVYKNPDAKDLKVLVVDYDNDTASLKKFQVGQQSTLILYKGDQEINRSSGVTEAADILEQIKA